MRLVCATTLLGFVVVISACATDPVGTVDTKSPVAAARSTCGSPPPRAGTIALVSLPLAQTATLKSLNSDNPTNITFTNATCIAISIYWLDFEGNRVFYADIPPGVSYVQNTFLTHPWVVTNANGDIGLFLPVPDGANAQEAYITWTCLLKSRIPPKITNGCGGVRG
jgi:hypothetical protein